MPQRVDPHVVAGDDLEIRKSLAGVARASIVAAGFLPALVLRALNVRILPIMASRVGHLALEPDCYVKEEQLGLHPHYRAVICAPRNSAANQRLAEYWSAYFHVVRAPWACFALRLLAFNERLRVDVSSYAMVIRETATFGQIQKEWADRPPLLQLDAGDAARGEQRLCDLGLPPGAWFVCVHCREEGYSAHDDHLHSFRNSAIDDYRLAMEAIVERGGWCIRVGDRSMTKLPPMRNVVDYAHHPLRADWMDVFLSARCQFFLGSPSGAYMMACVFGVPVAIANQAPLSTVLPFGKKDLGIPKLVWSNRQERILTFPEILDSQVGDMRFTKDYVEAGVELIDNTPQEIRGLALEQLERTTGKLTYTADDNARQTGFKALLGPGHYTYGSESRVGRDFLREHERLLAR